MTGARKFSLNVIRDFSVMFKDALDGLFRCPENHRKLKTVFPTFEKSTAAFFNDWKYFWKNHRQSYPQMIYISSSFVYFLIKYLYIIFIIQLKYTIKEKQINLLTTINY